MNIKSEACGRALAEYRDYERETLERINAEEQRHNAPVAVDGYEIPPTRRIHGKLTVRW